MTEQMLSNSTDTPSSIPPKKELSFAETNDHVNTSILRRTASNKLHVSALSSISGPPSVSTATPPISVLETHSVPHEETRVLTTAPSTIENIDEPRAMVDNEVLRSMLAQIRAFRQRNGNDGDVDSFDDEDEAFVEESMYSTASITPVDSVLLPCPICLDSAVLHPSPCCSFSCCQACWTAHVIATINDGRIQVPCIANPCNKFLPRELIINTIRFEESLYARYVKLYSIFNQSPRSKTCPRCSTVYSLDALAGSEIPSTKEKNGKVNDKKLPKEVQCSACSLVWCFRCHAPWHENLTCKQFVKGDKQLNKWMKQKNDDQWNARKCPKCSSYIQRAGGCPHMTCRSCSCEFCYLCGRRYVKIPVIGQHGNRFSMFGCPYNLHPKKPWLRRTIRGAIATGVIVASPVLLVGAASVAVFALPTVGVYRLVRHVRARRMLRNLNSFPVNHLNIDVLDEDQVLNEARLVDGRLRVVDPEMFGHDIRERLDMWRRRAVERNLQRNFPLSIFADMDVENLFNDTIDDHSHTTATDFRTCPNTPAVPRRLHISRSLNDLRPSNTLTVHRPPSIDLVH